MTPFPPADTKVVVVDAYGTLFDVHSAVARQSGLPDGYPDLPPALVLSSLDGLLEGA